jgi:hypothetical protein
LYSRFSEGSPEFDGLTAITTGFACKPVHGRFYGERQSIFETLMSSKFKDATDLQPPGAGLPALERVTLNFIFKTAAAVVPARQALKLFRRESAELLRLADEDESYDVFQILIIPRVIGIEDSSRNWSVLMVLEHLFLTNKDMLEIIKALVDGVVPRGEVDVAMYKPEPNIGYDVLNRYRDLNNEYEESIERLLQSRGNLNTAARYRHPWFGRLDAHQWHCLAAIHQRIHRRQMQKLVAMLGVT